MNEDGTLKTPIPGVLGNDTDIDSASVTAVLVSGPSNASTFTLNPDGSFTYSPDANFNGSDSFTYKANDGALDSNVATVTITVNPVNDPPLANSGGTFQMGEDAAFNSPSNTSCWGTSSPTTATPTETPYWYVGAPSANRLLRIGTSTHSPRREVTPAIFDISSFVTGGHATLRVGIKRGVGVLSRWATLC